MGAIFRFLFLLSSLIANASWIVALVSQAIAAGRFEHEVVGVLWFALVVQLFVNIATTCTLLARSPSTFYRSQVATFAAISVVFGGIGIDANIFSNVAVRKAMASAWIIIAAIDVLWIVYFTLDVRSPAWKFLHDRDSGNFSLVHSQADVEDDARREEKEENEHEQNDTPPMTQHPTSMFSDDVSEPLQPPNVHRIFAQSTDYAPSSSDDHLSRLTQPISQTSFMTDRFTDGLTAPYSEKKSEPSSDPSSTPSSAPSYSRQARALYTYTARPVNAGDARLTQLSFEKGEVLHVSVGNSKWWPAKTRDGSTGVAPSNFLKLLPE